jgi:tetratricopeptide (TPR) repeat protein
MVKTNQNPSESEKGVLENPDSVNNRLFQAEDFFVKYRNLILGVLGAIVLAVAGYLAYNFWLQEQDVEAQQKMYPAVLHFEADSLNKALEGDTKNPGLRTIADEYSSTKSGKLASFYVGAIYLKKGKFEDAITYLKNFSSDDLLVQARAYSLIGDANMELKKYDEAADYYTKAVNYKPNAQFTPVYMIKAALANELKNDFKTAVEIYDQLINDYPRSQQANDAKKYRAVAQSQLESK